MKLNLASWNIRGFNDKTKQNAVEEEWIRYKIDGLGIQETKTKIEAETELKHGFKFILLPQNFHQLSKIW